MAASSAYDAQSASSDSAQSVFTFNPSKTFGGERSKLGIFPLKRPDDFNVPSAGIASKPVQQPIDLIKPLEAIDYIRKEERRPNLNKFINGMELLHKQFHENQLKLEQSSGLGPTSVGSYLPYRFDDKKYI